MIVSFADKRTEAIWLREPTKRIPPGNNLKALSGDREGQHSIRVNDQWRLCFTWTTAGVEAVELVDYH